MYIKYIMRICRICSEYGCGSCENNWINERVRKNKGERNIYKKVYDETMSELLYKIYLFIPTNGQLVHDFKDESFARGKQLLPAFS